ncbi:hypothetical protein DUNSADRAFT_16725 [Dunaliella salina]|uniref:Essential protein Yae1 N-terminal domain-containing protein n=1 Tax=Dunaliella salina TaxID=3046 RepID=A0ABQ7G310_DUNSA|nr:hypothetical protein DUNSADRAFT_16725 [Dunaliella salina]|eukprot:KAF5828996.1 hypothetical protein DUNSADRAFT_16725 [Dunaliella salina]
MSQVDSSDGGDVWGEDSDEEDAHGELAREQQARNKYHYNTGYREGVEAGKERTLQPGFNLGFKEGAEAGFEWGSIKATVKTLEILCGQVPGTSKMQRQAQELATRVQAVPAREAMLGALRQCLTRPVQMPAHQGPEPPEGDTELAQAFARLSTKQQEQPSGMTGPAQGINPPLSLPNMEEVAEELKTELSRLGFCPPSITNRGASGAAGESSHKSTLNPGSNINTVEGESGAS